MGKGLEKLRETLTHILADKNKIKTIEPVRELKDPNKVRQDMANIQNITPIEEKNYSREEITHILMNRASKYAYNLSSKIAEEESYNAFKSLALKMFSQSVDIYYYNKKINDIDDMVELIVQKLSENNNNNIHVLGLPGSAKNMLLQLAYYKMTYNFIQGHSNCLPYYISVNYFEKVPYNLENVDEQMHLLMKKELSEYFTYLEKNPSVSPVLFMDAIREHNITTIAPETVLFDILKGLGKYSRIT